MCKSQGRTRQQHTKHAARAAAAPPARGWLAVFAGITDRAHCIRRALSLCTSCRAACGQRLPLWLAAAARPVAGGEPSSSGPHQGARMQMTSRCPRFPSSGGALGAKRSPSSSPSP